MVGIKKFDLNPTVEIECPFCGGKYKRDLETLPLFEIECPCGALIEFGVDFEWGRATLKED